MQSFLIPRLRSSLPLGKRTILGIVDRNAILIFNSSISSLGLSEFESNHNQLYSFTASYLINSCGFSPNIAAALLERKNFRLKNTDTPNAVLDLLKAYGFSQTQVSMLVKKQPLVLLANPETTLLPKLKFFHSIGLSDADLPKTLIKSPKLLARSLENCLIPRYEILKSVLYNEGPAVSALKRNPLAFLYCDVINDLAPNIEVLRLLGVPQSSISFLVTNFPDVAYMKHSKFVEAVKKAKEMGFDLLKTSFVKAVRVLSKMNKAKWESKLELYKRWGWSNDDSLLAFKKFPLIMICSDDKIVKLRNFLVRDMGWPLDDIIKFPVVFSYSLEKRVIPRCLVVKILKSKGLVSLNLSLAFINFTEPKFLRKFVTRFEEDIPLLLNVYEGRVDIKDVLQSQNIMKI